MWTVDRGPDRPAAPRSPSPVPSRASARSASPHTGRQFRQTGTDQLALAVGEPDRRNGV